MGIYFDYATLLEILQQHKRHTLAQNTQQKVLLLIFFISATSHGGALEGEKISSLVFLSTYSSSLPRTWLSRSHQGPTLHQSTLWNFSRKELQEKRTSQKSSLYVLFFLFFKLHNLQFHGFYLSLLICAAEIHLRQKLATSRFCLNLFLVFKCNFKARNLYFFSNLYLLEHTEIFLRARTDRYADDIPCF